MDGQLAMTSQGGDSLTQQTFMHMGASPAHAVFPQVFSGNPLIVLDTRFCGYDK
jgi:hypothetical protein